MVVDLKESREKIDRIDKEITRLFEERMEVANDVAAYKRSTGKKGYDPDWVHQRLLSIRIRNELTDEWQRRGVGKGREFAILTDEISRAWSGMTTRQYKNLKGLKKENLRDNMSDTELVLTMLAEASTRDISKASKPVGFDESVKVAKRGGNVANVARQQLEAETGQPVITSQNAAQLNAVVTEMIEASAQAVDRQDDSKSK